MTSAMIARPYYCVIRRTEIRSDVAQIRPCRYNGAEQWRIVDYVQRGLRHKWAQDMVKQLNATRRQKT